MNAGQWWLDAKLGFRMLLKYPGLAVAGGAGIAVTVAIAVTAYSLIHENFLVRSIPLEEGDRVVALELWDQAAHGPEARILQDFRLWRQEVKTVEEISAFTVLTPNLIVPGVGSAVPESVRVAAMSASGFGVARVRPVMGRYLEERDELTGAPPVMVIGESVWRSRFAADPGILGRTVQLGSVAHTVVGVMPKGFAFPFNDQYWVPLVAARAEVAEQPLTGPGVVVFGRLASGATIESAQTELTAIGQRRAQANAKVYGSLQPQVLPYGRPFAGVHSAGDASGLVAMQGLLVSLLVLVCLNVTILVYTRTAMRQGEIGLRTALGASRGRIVSQLFLEALVLSGAAAVAGVGIAWLGLRSIGEATQPFAASLPYWVSFRLSPEAIVYAVTLSVLAAAIVGIIPALQATRGSLLRGLRVAGADGGGMRLGKTWTVLIVAQVGFAVAILPPAVASAWEDTRYGLIGLGFPAERFLAATVGMDLPVVGGEGSVSGQRFAMRQEELLRRLESEPMVAGATFAASQPGDEQGARVEVESDGAASLSSYSVRWNRVGVDFFRTFDVPVLAGRSFGAADAGGAAVIVNLPLAQQVFGGNAALGKRIRYAGEDSRWYEIVGVVADFPTGVSAGMRDSAMKMYHAGAVGEVQPAALAIRMREGSGLLDASSAFAHRLREIAGAVDPELHVREIRGLDEVLRREQWIIRMEAVAFAAIAASVLLLSSAGIYALMSFTVSQRRREVGIRMALGADKAGIVRSIFSRALWQLGAGAALGGIVGVTAEQLSDGELLRGSGMVVVPVVIGAMLLVGFAAAYGPTRRSLRIDPSEALREQ